MGGPPPRRGYFEADSSSTDGSGAPVLVRSGSERVASSRSVDEGAATAIDVDGAMVAPGFVNLHTHNDAQVVWDPALTPSSQALQRDPIRPQHPYPTPPIPL